MARERATGIRNFQAKLGADPGRRRRRVLAVLDATGPGDAVTGDANGAWRRQDAIIAARLLEGAERFRLEQPCPTLEECLAVRRLTTLPMVLDEVIVDLPTLVRAAGLDAMDQMNLKIGRVGGLLPARLMRDTAVSLGHPADDRGQLGRRRRHGRGGPPRGRDAARRRSSRSRS